MKKTKNYLIFILIIIFIGILILFSLNFYQEEKTKKVSKPDYLTKAQNLLETLSLDEKIGQLLLVRFPENNQIEIMNNYKLGGFVFYSRDLNNKTEDEVKKMISDLQQNTKIPLLNAIDEEGGKVSRLSTNPNLVTEKFKSPSELYESGGFEAIKNDTINKSNILANLGFNLNLAPVVDVSTDKNDYIYERTLKLDTNDVATYAKTVIEASKNTKVSYTLKHFPGYGNSKDTHNNMAINYESWETIKEKYLPPFKEGIAAGAEAIMVSHNIMDGIDKEQPASLSEKIHSILKNDLNFKGIIITDDLAMGAVKDIPNVTTKAFLAGNDILITTDYKQSFDDLKNSLETNIISQDKLNDTVLKILTWKYYKGLLE